MTTVEARLRESGIIAILRGDFPLTRVAAIAEALASGGIGAVEITLNSSSPLEAIGTMRGVLGDRMLIGAGTVRSADDVDAAIDAGAEFLVSPNFDPASVERSLAAGVLHLPGILTPSEAQAAFAAGCSLVKLFPTDAVGPGYLRALRAPLDDIGFIAVGGIDEHNLADYILAGAVGVGVGSSLVKGPHDEPEAIQARAEKLSAALRNARDRARGVA